MSRTKRKHSKTKHRYKKHDFWFRHPETKNAQTLEYHAKLELEEAGFTPSNRQTARANPASGKIVTAWDGLPTAARFETDYRHGVKVL